MIKPNKIVGTLLPVNDPLKRVYEAIYNTADPIISDHRVYGVVIVPGSFHLARLFAAIYYCYNIASFNITEIKFTNPLLIKDGSIAKVNMTIIQENAITYNFLISSEIAIHAEGVFVVGSSSDVKLTGEAAMSNNEIDINKFDEYFKKCHLTYGHGYKWITKLVARDYNSLCYMRDHEPASELDGLMLHPGQIDCSFQGFLAITLALAETSNNNDAWILGNINQIKIYKKPQGKIKCHNTMLNFNEFTVESRKITGDIALYDEKNNLVADFLGVLAVKVSTDKIKGLTKS